GVALAAGRSPARGARGRELLWTVRAPLPGRRRAPGARDLRPGGPRRDAGRPGADGARVRDARAHRGSGRPERDALRAAQRPVFVAADCAEAGAGGRRGAAGPTPLAVPALSIRGERSRRADRAAIDRHLDPPYRHAEQAVTGPPTVRSAR